MTALDKVLLAAGRPAAQSAGISGHSHASPGDELVMAAQSAAADLLLLLAWDPDNDGDDDSSKSGDTDKDYAGKKSGSGDSSDGEDSKGWKAHSDHPAFKKFVKNGMKNDAAAKACAKSDKLKASAELAAGVLVALAGLDVPEYDWVEATAFDPHAVSLADGASQPYGNVPYADPGYRDGKKRYPIDKEHIRAALSYFSKPKNREPYSGDQVKSIWGKIKSAARKFGIDLSPDTGKVAASMSEAGILALARGSKPGGPASPMFHGPFTGTHSHGHHVRAVHDHQHFHNNDSSHDDHAHMGQGDTGQGGVATDAGGW